MDHPRAHPLRLISLKGCLYSPLRWGVLLFVLYLYAQPLFASPWLIFGFDGPSMGLGNAMAGGVSGPAAVVYNPAGLAHSETLEVRASYLYARPFLSYSQDPNPALKDFSRFSLLDPNDVCAGQSDQDTCLLVVKRYNRYVQGAKALYSYQKTLDARIEERARSPQTLQAISGGAVYPLPRQYLPFPVSVGGSLFALLDPFVVIYQRIKGQDTPYFLRFDDTPHRIAIDLGAGLEPFPWLRIGGGGDFLIDVIASPEAQVVFPPELHIFSPFPLPNPNIKDIRFFVDGKVEEPVVIVPVLGFQVSPLPWLEFGGSFREEQKARIKLSGVAQVFTPVGISEVPVELLTSTAFTPRTLAGGLRLGPFKYRELKTTIYGEVQLQRWSTYQPPFGISGQIGGVSSVSCDLVRSLSDLEDLAQTLKQLPNGNLFANLLNPDALCSLLQGNVQNQISFQTFDRTLVEFRDTYNPGVGLSLALKAWELNLGYRYEPSAVGPQTNIYNILDPDRNIYSFFLGYHLNDRITLGAYAQLHTLKKTHTLKEKYQKQELKNLDPSSTPDAYPDPNFSNTSFDPALKKLEDEVAGVQLIRPGYPGFTAGGSYLVGGVHVSLAF